MKNLYEVTINAKVAYTIEKLFHHVNYEAVFSRIFPHVVMANNIDEAKSIVSFSQSWNSQNLINTFKYQYSNNNIRDKMINLELTERKLDVDHLDVVSYKYLRGHMLAHEFIEYKEMVKMQYKHDKTKIS